MGVEKPFGFEQAEFTYQNIYDNISQLSDELIKEINAIILDFGNKEVFKKKENSAMYTPLIFWDRC